MKIAFLAERRSEVSVLGGVLHELRRRGHEIIAVRNGTMTPKAAEDRCSIGALAAEWPGVCVMRQAPPDALGLASAGTQFVAERTVVVDYCWDGLFQNDGFVTHATAVQRQMHWRHGVVVGSPALAWLQRFQCPQAFLFFMPKLRRSRGIVWALAWAARRAAHRRGLRLVGMTRQKHGRSAVPFMDAWAAVDGRFWPPPVQRALQTAIIALHFQSGVELECAAMEIPTYRVTWPLARTLTYEQRAIMQWKQANLMPGQSWLHILRALSAGESPSPRAADFEVRYLGPRDVHTRVADYCEELCVS